MINLKKFFLADTDNKEFYCEPCMVNLVTQGIKNGQHIVIMVMLGKVTKYLKGDAALICHTSLDNCMYPVKFRRPDEKNPGVMRTFDGFINPYNIGSLQESIPGETLVTFKSSDVVIVAMPVRKFVHVLIEKKRKLIRKGWKIMPKGTGRKKKANDEIRSIRKQVVFTPSEWRIIQVAKINASIRSDSEIICKLALCGVSGRFLQGELI